MPVFIVDNHVELIDELLKIEDISREILEHIDMEEMDRIDRRKKDKVEDKTKYGNAGATIMIVGNSVRCDDEISSV